MSATVMLGNVNISYTSSTHPLRWVVVLSALAFLVMRLSVICYGHERQLLSFFSDDAFYYFKIAQNIVSHHKATFDGESITNGYHPLWMIMLLPIFGVLSDATLALRIVAIISSLLLVVAFWTSWLYISRYFTAIPAVASTLVSFYCLMNFSRYSMDTSLLLPLIIGTLYWLSRYHGTDWPIQDTRSLYCMGALLALVELVRLDAVFLVVLTILFVLPKLSFTSTLKLAFFPFLAGSAYLGLNYLFFGHLMPVSGYVKSMGSESVNVLFLKQLLQPHPWWAMFGISLVLATWHGYRVLLRGRSHALPFPEGVVRNANIASTFIIVFAAYQTFFTGWSAWQWYAYPSLLVTVFVMPIWMETLWSRVSERYAALASALLRFSPVLLLTGMAAVLIHDCRKLHLKVDYRYDNYVVANLMNQRFASLPTVAMGDRAGSFAFFYKGNVIQLEGLVGGYELAEAVKNNSLRGYISAHGASYVVSWQSHSDRNFASVLLSIPSPGFSNGPRATLELCADTLLLEHKNDELSLLIWKWPSCGQ